MENDVKKVFSSIYETWFWGAGNESRSGPGSNLDQTNVIVKEIPRIIKKYEIKTIFDASCGSFNWMKHVDLSGAKYVGSDIVDEIVLENQTKYSNENISFISLDVITDKLPKSDLIILRDTLFHFSNDQIIETLQNIKKSKSSFLLTTSYLNSQHTTGTNIDISTGDWRYLNLEISPFFLREPLERIFEVPWLAPHSDRTLSLWKIDSLPNWTS
jgi:2-polyprenyl-3-methyl-5-hydroxy-6-metoxy-1,4-benzoquinol methylase